MSFLQQHQICGMIERVISVSDGNIKKGYDSEDRAISTHVL